MDAAHLILKERRRQLVEGHAHWSDDEQTGGELLLAALAYVCSPGESIWPWEIESFKPTDDPIRNIVTAGALVAAEGDRLLRRRAVGLPVVGGMIVLGLDADEIISNVEALREVNKDMRSIGARRA